MHIQQNDNDDFEDESDIIVNELLKDGTPSFGFEVSRLKSIEVSDSLLSSAYNFHADLMIIIPDNQDFMSALLFRSITKEMVLKSDIPILFIRSYNTGFK